MREIVSNIIKINPTCIFFLAVTSILHMLSNNRSIIGIKMGTLFLKSVILFSNESSNTFLNNDSG